MNEKKKCLICGINISPKGTYYGLLPQQKKIDVVFNNDGELTTSNNIPFTVTKESWFENPYRCYGVIVHQSCYNLLKEKLGIELTFDSVFNHIKDNNNLLKNVNYSEIKAKSEEKPCEKEILKIWYGFMKYKIRIMQRKKCVNNMREVRGLRYQSLKWRY